MSVDNLLRNTNLGEVAEIWANPLVSISPQDSVLEALGTLSANRITSAPVVDEDGEAFGSIDMVDLVTYAIQKLDPECSGRPIDESRIREFLNKQPIVNLMDISHRNGYLSIPAHKSAYKARNFLCHPNIHRVYVSDSLNYMIPIGVLTQSKFIDFLLLNCGYIKDELSRRIGDLFPEKQYLVSVSLNDSLLTAFRRINEFGVTGIPVLNNDGAIVANISASDLKFIDFSNPPRMMSLLQRPIAEFLQNMCVTEGIQMVSTLNQISLFYSLESQPHLLPVVVNAENTIETAMRKANSVGVHRVYRVDEMNKPIGVLSLSDMARAVCF